MIIITPISFRWEDNSVTYIASHVQHEREVGQLFNILEYDNLNLLKIIVIDFMSDKI